MIYDPSALPFWEQSKPGPITKRLAEQDRLQQDAEERDKRHEWEMQVWSRPTGLMPGAPSAASASRIHAPDEASAGQAQMEVGCRWVSLRGHSGQ